MNFFTLGSCIANEIVKLSGNPSVDDYISVSPFSFLNSCNEKKIIFAASVLDDSSNKAVVTKKLNELNGNILFDIKSKADKLKDYRIIVDLSDFRISALSYTANDTTFTFTANRFTTTEEEKIIAVIKNKFESATLNKKVLNAYQMSDEELSKNVNSYVKLLTDTFGKDKLIFIKPKLATNYLENGEILFVPNFITTGNVNMLIDKIYSFLPSDIKYVNPPANIIGDTRFLPAFQFHFCKPYYEYGAKAIEMLCSDNSDAAYDKINAMLTDYERQIHSLYNEIFCESLLSSVKNIALNKDIVAVAKSQQFAQMFKNRYGKEVYANVFYDENSDIKSVTSQLDKFKKNNKNVVLVFPEFFKQQDVSPENNIFRMLYDIGFTPMVDFLFYVPQRINLKNFSGYYSDIFSNTVLAESAVSSLSLIGSCASVSVLGKSNTFKASITAFTYSDVEISDRITATNYLENGIQAFHCSRVKIGQNCAFMRKFEIVAAQFAVAEIGENSIFADGFCILAGNAHPIFDTVKKNKFPSKGYVIIKNHVWAGRNVLILDGSEIADGSIIGAASVVAGKIPNNCIAVGSPAKVIKRNRTWVRNSFFQQIEQDAVTYERYCNPTEDDKQ